MFQQALAKTYTVDICIMEEGLVVRGAELDIRRVDKKGSGKFDGYGDGDEEIQHRRLW